MPEPEKRRTRIRWRRGTDAKPGASVIVDCVVALINVGLFALFLASEGRSWLTALWLIIAALMCAQAAREVRLWRRARQGPSRRSDRSAQG